MDTNNKDTLLKIAPRIIKAHENRPNYDEAYAALFSAYLSMKHQMEALEDIVSRGSRFRMYENEYQQRKHEFDKVI